MSIIENLENWITLPDQFLWELLKVEKYKRSATVTILTLIEQKQRESSKNQVFKELQPQWIRANEEQRNKVKNHFFEIQTKIKKYYWPDIVEHYADDIIKNLFPEEAESIIEIRNNIKKDLNSTNL